MNSRIMLAGLLAFASACTTTKYVVREVTPDGDEVVKYEKTDCSGMEPLQKALCERDNEKRRSEAWRATANEIAEDRTPNVVPGLAPIASGRPVPPGYGRPIKAARLQPSLVGWPEGATGGLEIFDLQRASGMTFEDELMICVFIGGEAQLLEGGEDTYIGTAEGTQYERKPYACAPTTGRIFIPKVGGAGGVTFAVLRPVTDRYTESGKQVYYKICEKYFTFPSGSERSSRSLLGGGMCPGA